jgi:hypothetical protein
MSRNRFKELLDLPAKREYRNAIKLDPEMGQFVMRTMSVAFEKQRYSRPGKSPGGPRINTSAPFAFESLEKEWKAFTNDKRGRKSATFDMRSGLFQFHWHADGGSNASGTDLNWVETDSRKFIGKQINWAKQNIKGYKEPTEKEIGGHIEAQGFLQRIRQAREYGVISAEEAEDLRYAYLHGGMDKAMEGIGADVGVSAEGKEAYGANLDQGFLNINENQESARMKDSLIKEINENSSKYDIYREVIIPIPDSLNTAQKDNYERAQMKRLIAFLERLADARLYENPTSPSMEKMHQEIIAAALLGKISPKYKVNYAIKRNSKPQKKKKSFKLPKTKRTATRAARAKFFTQLRASATQNPTSLMALINTKLQRELTDNMGQPALENITGRFANSVRVLKVTESKAGKSIQYTYDRDPYGVFEEDRARDPRRLIDRTIREIAAELVMGKFTTQRL